jgi:ectoine hydroxylase-related dioxygenase (phytanoyl-CoA dioxygenase family)
MNTANIEGKSYGIAGQAKLDKPNAKYIEEIAIQGYTIVENVLPADKLEETRKRLDAVYKRQEEEAGGADRLAAINELNMARLPLAYDEFFLEIATQPLVLDIVREIVGKYFVLHLQNGIINMPKLEHHQSSWHRDLPYQDFVISTPLSLSALFCIDDFTPETGGTFVVPFTHKLTQMPSEEYVKKHAVQVSAPAGSVVIMDSMIHHRAGHNISNRIRRGINHMYVTGILKQQVDIPRALDGKYSDDPFLRMLLGYESDVPAGVNDWRKRREQKMGKK